MTSIRASTSRGATLPLTSRYAWENNVSSRPSTSQSFPERHSKNPFFSRHVPHPSKVRHIRGLLDFPICTVLGSDYNENNPKQAKQWLNGSLQKQIRLPRKKEKFVPGIGIVNTNQGWLENFHDFTKQVGSNINQPISKQNQSRLDEKLAMPTTNTPILNPLSREGIASRLSQRLPTRSSTRQQTRQQTRPISKMRLMEENFVREACTSRLSEKTKAETITENLKQDTGPQNQKFVETFKEGSGPNNVKFVEDETYVFHLLSAILQTDSIDDIKHWFLEAPTNEKEVVLDMVRAVANTNRDFREGMTHLKQMKQAEIYEKDFLHHEDSLNIEEINNYNKQHNKSNEQRQRQSIILERLDEAVNFDVQQASRKSSRHENMNWGMFPKISEEDAEIEDIRSRLASRSNVSVLNSR